MLVSGRLYIFQPVDDVVMVLYDDYDDEKYSS